MSTDIFAVLVAVAMGASGYAIGWLRGRNYGRDEGWVDCVLNAAKADRERRDARGRFKKREVQS